MLLFTSANPTEVTLDDLAGPAGEVALQVAADVGRLGYAFTFKVDGVVLALDGVVPDGASVVELVEHESSAQARADRIAKLTASATLTELRDIAHANGVPIAWGSKKQAIADRIVSALGVEALVVPELEAETSQSA